MFKFLTYRTPSKFFAEFDDYYSYSNLRQVRIISGIIFTISCLVRTLSFIFNDEVALLAYHQELSFSNWIQFFGSLAFFLASAYALKSRKVSKSLRKAIVLFFVIYMLTMSFSVSYIMSLHNAKNMLTMFLIGIATTSLFFALEFKTLLLIIFYTMSLYLAGLIFPDLPIQQKILNCVAAIILGTVLLSFSRYSYYFKSSHFVKLKELEEKNREILHLSSQKSEILSFVAHDLRAPLNNIEALSQIMLLENEHDSEAQMIADSAMQAKNIINDLIEAVKLDQTEILTENIPLKAYINRIINKWEANTDRKIILQSGGDEISLQANPSKLERVIDNLISNALKFSPADKPIDIFISQQQNNAIIKVEDFGIGIPQDLQSHIFEQFSRASRKGLQGEKSIGLGLHISHKIIEQHHGELLVDSKENQGTTFTIQLPLAIA
ncbi:sensor histidine kinase KdpD [Pedobacter sp. ASV28]|uniref:sensor histidine kinase n=1 Tax=Pedobacter sp. ASV28 TaxID=2795123 RepID=UPI0018EDD841|nr:HAMP domain-containing sensor histidine kinase [Pedobacter sp. ASV28]